MTPSSPDLVGPAGTGASPLAASDALVVVGWTLAAIAGIALVARVTQARGWRRTLAFVVVACVALQLLSFVRPGPLAALVLVTGLAIAHWWRPA